MFRLLIEMTLAVALGVPPATTAPAARPDRSEIEKLITELSSRSFAQRQSAQEKLKSLGEPATAVVILHLPNDDDDVARRIVELIGKPRDITLRVESAARLIETTDPDWMERGVHLLFDDPSAACDLFAEKTHNATGRAQAMFTPILEQLRRTKARHEFFQSKLEKWRKQDPENAAHMQAMDRESDLYDADAAYWSAMEVLDDWENNRIPASSAPTRKPPTEVRPKGGPGQTRP